MFENCTLLEVAPHLPAKSLVSSCYNGIFQNCKNLKKISIEFEQNCNSNYTYYWLYGTSTSGIVCKSNNTPDLIVDNTYGIPRQWKIEELTDKPNYDELIIKKI